MSEHNDQTRCYLVNKTILAVYPGVLAIILTSATISYWRLLPYHFLNLFDIGIGEFIIPQW